MFQKQKHSQSLINILRKGPLFFYDTSPNRSYPKGKFIQLFKYLPYLLFVMLIFFLWISSWLLHLQLHTLSKMAFQRKKVSMIKVHFPAQITARIFKYTLLENTPIFAT